MKKLLLSFLLCISGLYAQIDFSTFPKIGFGDWIHVAEGSQHWIDSNYYYHRNHELGYDYLWGSSNHNGIALGQDLKLLDDVWFGKFGGYDPDLYLFYHCWSAANDNDHLAYQVGGDVAHIPNLINDFFGFGTPTQTSWWASALLPNMTGNRNWPDLGRTVFYAGKNIHDPGVLLYGKINSLHTWFGNNTDGSRFRYTLDIFARRGNDYNSYQDTIAVIKVWEEIWQTDENGSEYPRRSLGESLDPVGDTTYYYIKPSDFSGTDYTSIKIGNLEKVNGTNSEFRFTVYWRKKCSLYIDKFSIHDQYYEDLFVAPEPIREAVRDTIIMTLTSNPYFSGQNPNYCELYIDEPLTMYYRSIDYVSGISESVSGNKFYINGALGNPTDWDMHLGNYQRPGIPYIISDVYPFRDDIPDTQEALDLLISKTGINDAGTYKIGLKYLIQWADNFTPNDPADDRPFIQTIQVQDEDITDVLGNETRPFLRAPTHNEILVQGNLALCYGAKGLMYYCTWTSWGPLPNNEYLHYFGLMEHQGYVPGTHFQDKSLPLVPNYRFWAVKEMNEEIDLIGDELLSLTWKDAFSFHKEEERNRLYSYQGHYITDLKSYKVYEGIPELDILSQSFVEVGVFKKTSEFSNNLLEYFMLVNRRGLETEGRTYEVTYDKLGTQYVNWSITDIATGNYWSGLANNMFAIYVEPGKGKLFSLEPTVIGGGSLYHNEVIQSDIELKRDLVIENGVTLTVNADYHCYGNITLNGGTIKGNGKIVFHNNKRINIAQGTNQIYGSLGLIEIDFTAPHHMNGIQVLQNTNFRVWNCIIRNARVGITAGSNVSYFRASNVRFFNCVDGGINIYGPLSSTPVVSLCQFNSLSHGVMATNLSEILVAYNQFINNDNGITLINVTNPYINNNSIASNKKILPGIFLESCNGVIRNNNISGHTNGIHLGNSSPDIGVNQITNNLYHGIYIGTGSLPKMDARLYYDPPIYYPVAGYNQIWENGGTTTGGPIDNDGSEIFFNTSNAEMREGCNSIYDDRSGGEHPPYNTRLLMNGFSFGTPIRIQAEFNFWSENPLYPLNERFGNLTVYYEPFWEVPCEIPGGGGSSEELFVKSSTGEVIDTLYPVQRTVENLSSTDLLYAVAEEKFISADYTGAEEIFNQIVNGGDSLEVKLPAYSRLYQMGKLSSKPESYFDDLNILYTSLVQATSDSLMKSIFTQLGSLSLIGKKEYIQAIDEFDNIIQQNPGSEKAVYAEIDAFTTAILIEKGDTTLGKSAAQNYIVNSSEYESKISTLLKNNFGAPQKTELAAVIPTSYYLYQNYPNPFNPVTTIKYDLVEAGNIKLAVYDILGREIAILVNGQQQPGRYEVQFNASNLASGVYIYQIRADNYVDGKKMILLR